MLTSPRNLRPATFPILKPRYLRPSSHLNHPHFSTSPPLRLPNPRSEMETVLSKDACPPAGPYVRNNLPSSTQPVRIPSTLTFTDAAVNHVVVPSHQSERDGVRGGADPCRQHGRAGRGQHRGQDAAVLQELGGDRQGRGVGSEQGGAVWSTFCSSSWDLSWCVLGAGWTTSPGR